MSMGGFWVGVVVCVYWLGACVCFGLRVLLGVVFAASWDECE